MLLADGDFIVKIILVFFSIFKMSQIQKSIHIYAYIVPNMTHEFCFEFEIDLSLSIFFWFFNKGETVDRDTFIFWHILDF